jgi:hypothetical protein
VWPVKPPGSLTYYSLSFWFCLLSRLSSEVDRRPCSRRKLQKPEAGIVVCLAGLLDSSSWLLDSLSTGVQNRSRALVNVLSPIAISRAKEKGYFGMDAMRPVLLVPASPLMKSSFSDRSKPCLNGTLAPADLLKSGDDPTSVVHNWCL